MTDSRSAGLQSAVFAGREQFVIRGAGIAGRGAVAWRRRRRWRCPPALRQARGILRAAWTPRRWSASAAIPRVAPVLATRVLRRRPAVLLHEQNAVLGRANRFLARRADAAGAELRGDAACARRDECAGHRQSGASGDRRAGADQLRSRRPTRSACWCWAARSARACSATWCRRHCARCPMRCAQRIALVQQCRPEDLDRVRAAYADSGIAAELSPFFPDVADRLVCRASGDRPRRRFDRGGTRGGGTAVDPGAAARRDRRPPDAPMRAHWPMPAAPG